MRILLVLLILTSGVFSFSMQAQTIDDAIRYSLRDRIGTARSFGTANAMSVLGGDFGSVAINPAGMATYKSAEVQFSPGFFFGPSTSQLTRSTRESGDGNRTNVMIPSASYVNMKRLLDKHWKHTSFGIGFNRVMNYNRNFTYSGDQDFSIAQLFIEQSNGINPDFLDEFVGGPAYDAFITTYDTYTGTYFADIDRTTVVNKMQEVDQRGGIDEFTVAFGADYENKFQLGAAVTFPIVSFKEKKSYVETLANHPVFNSLEFEENLTASGGGVAIKAGIKYIIAKRIHLGAAFHSPTWMRITEDFDNRAVYDYSFDPDIFPEAGPGEGLSPLGTFEYDFRSPWRAIGGLGVIVGKAGFISADIEYVDYSTSQFTISADPAYEFQLNEEIKNELGDALALRIGGELRIDNWRFRGGLGLSESVYANLSGFEDSFYSVGAGIWFNRLFIDAAFRHQTKEQRYSPYTLAAGPSPIVTSDLNENNVIITVGYKI